MTSKEIREKFIKFFEEKGHKYREPASLIPKTDDPSVLFTTAGMQQFKSWFSGEEKAKYPRVVTIQPCLRTSDIDEVGDKTHLTFFEMLGNFSFNYPADKKSYFKKDAIEWAWEFLNSEAWLNIPKENISATYFNDKELTGRIADAIIDDTDIESLKYLKKIIGSDKISAKGDDNFWSLGTVGSPGGPTVEFYIDQVEVWNLVFNERILKDDPSRYWHWANIKGVDTGMGLERISAVMQKVDDIFRTDLLKPIIDQAYELRKLFPPNASVEIEPAYKIIVDHLRSSVFIASEDVIPSKEKRGAVLRRLLRRAYEVAIRLRPDGINKDYIHKLSSFIIDHYKENYPDLEKDREKILSIIDNEIIFTEKEIARLVPKINKRIRVLERYLKGETDKREGADPKWLNSAFVKKGDTPGIITGKFAYHLWNTNRCSKEYFWDYFQKNAEPEVKEYVNRNEFEIGYKEGKKEFKEVSRKGVEKKFEVGDKARIAQLHTATHILHETLRRVLGKHIEQRGQDINSERLRFDFSHPEKLTPEQLKEIEDKVNEVIAQKLPVNCEEVTVEEAKKQGARALFLDKYTGKVTMYSVGDYSKELCKGPHVKNTSELGSFKIIKEEASSAGVRRIKATLT